MARPQITVLSVAPPRWSGARWLPVDGVEPGEVGPELLRIDDQQHKIDIGVRPRCTTSPGTHKRNGANRVARRRPPNDSLKDTFGPRDMIPHLGVLRQDRCIEHEPE
jgi:hypothetical protein